MTELKIALISDLHIGAGAEDFQLQPKGERPPIPNFKGFLEYFSERVSEDSIEADILVVSGDITNKAQPSEFEHATTVINTIANSLKVSPNNIIIVPGNHDLNWDVCNMSTAHQEEFWKAYVFEPFVIECNKINNSTDHRELVKSPHIKYYEHEKASIFTFNSAAYDFPDELPHRGQIHDAHIAALKGMFEKKYGTEVKNKLRIFVTHHHPWPQPDIYGNAGDFSGMVNGDSLMDLLSEFNFDIVFHGHKHRPWCKTTLVNGSHPIAVWCSGSFSQKLTGLHGRLGNVWHLMKVSLAPDKSVAIGTCETWAYAPSQGWLPSVASSHSIEPICPFGPVFDMNTLEATLRSALKLKLAQSSSGTASDTILYWDAIRDQHDELRHQPGDVVWKLLKAVCPEFGLRPHGQNGSITELLIVTDKASK